MVAGSDPTQQAAALYAATFAGRQDAYSVWIPGREPDPGQWLAVRRPLTADVVINAFRTKIPISGYVFAPDSTTHLAMLDIDRADGLALGKKVSRLIDKIGGVGYLEPSRRGCHFWIVLDDARPGVMIRRALHGIISEAHLPDDKKIELRPGSDHLNGSDALGHCLRMPTMPHHLTGIRYSLFESSGLKLPDKLVPMMAAIQLCPVSVIEDLAERAPLPPLGNPDMETGHPYGPPDVSESATDLLLQLWGADPRARPGGPPTKCPAHDDKRPSLSILPDDQRAICHADGSGCILHNEGHGRGTHELRALAPKGAQP